MDITTTLTNLFGALRQQNFSFSETIDESSFSENADYLTDTKKAVAKALLSFNSLFVTYDNVDHEAFEHDLLLLKRYVGEDLITAWAFLSGSLSLNGIICNAAEIGEDRIKNIFSRFDDAVLNVIRRNVGQVFAGAQGALYGTLIWVFTDSQKAAKFNSKISNYYSSHFWKSTYVSSISIDCASETLTQGKAPMGAKWQGGMDISIIRKQLFK